MISPEIIHVNYIKKEAQTGSYCGMRYRLSKGKKEEGDCMDVTIWPEPFCFVKTPADQKTTKQFPLTQEGCLEAVAWLNEQQSSRREI